METPSGVSTIKRGTIPWKDFWLQRLHYEFKVLKTYKKWLLVCVIIQYMHSVATNFVYYLADRYGVTEHAIDEGIVDLGWRFLKFDDNEFSWISDLLTLSIMTIILVWCLTPFFNQNSRLSTVKIITRGLMVTSLAFVGRMMSFMVTIIPSPALHCQSSSSDYNPPLNAWEILFRMDAFKGCGDLIFSAHTVRVLIAVLVYNHYGSYCALRVLLWGCLGLLVFLIIGFQHQLSVDVVLALYIGPLVWYYILHEYPDNIEVFKIDYDNEESNIQSSIGSQGLDV